MPYIHIKEDNHRLFGSLPVMCRAFGYDRKQSNAMEYTFSNAKRLEHNKIEGVRIIKVELERSERR